jgi:murein DD-endopeptidase MepM/ murein hydrolase activator NlpD
MDHRFNGLSIVALALIVLGIFTVLADRDVPTRTVAAAVEPGQANLTATNTPFQPLPTLAPELVAITKMPVAEVAAEVVATEPPPVVEEDPPDRPEDIRLPYDDYVLTQGTHGASYGDAAIDIAAGRGADILSPISGQIILNGRDMYGNTILVIENEVWTVKLLHGEYYPDEGEWVGLGQMIGSESNIGYTIDSNGVSCRGRRCGYHTHMNVFDRRTGQNANIIKLLHP